MKSLQNLPIGRKFALIGLLMLLLCLPPVVLLVMQTTDTIRSTRQEREGVQPVGTLLQMLRQTQVHRGASTGWLGGNEGLKARRWTGELLTLAESLVERYGHMVRKRTVRLKRRADSDED